MNIKKNDTVLITSGKDKIKKGKVLTVFSEAGRIIVEGVNIRKKHVRPKRAGQKGETVSMPLPIHVSNVKLICPKCAKAVRVGHVAREKKMRVCKKCKGEF